MYDTLEQVSHKKETL